jgi:carbon storage regulator CsrA
MLVLKRKPNESVRIVGPDGCTVEITVVSVDGRDAVRLGFSAPPDVRIVRSELTVQPPFGRSAYEGEE